MGEFPGADITPQFVHRFGEFPRLTLDALDPALPEADVRMIVGRVHLPSDGFAITASKTAFNTRSCRRIGHRSNWCPVLTGNGARRGLERDSYLVAIVDCSYYFF